MKLENQLNKKKKFKNLIPKENYKEKVMKMTVKQNDNANINIIFYFIFYFLEIRIILISNS